MSLPFHIYNPVLDSAGVATADYIWSASGFNNLNNQVVGQPTRSDSYSGPLTSTHIEIGFYDNTGTLVNALTGGSIICWRIQ